LSKNFVALNALTPRLKKIKGAELNLSEGEARARQRDELFWGLSVTLGVIIFVAGFVGMVYFAQMFA
jgi:hypothetical protein